MILAQLLDCRLLDQISGIDINQDITTRTKVTVTCPCGATRDVVSRSLVRKWRGKQQYLCKSCHVKTYSSDPARITKFRESFAKVVTEEYRQKCSQNGKKPWADPVIRASLIAQTIEDNKKNPKKARARAIALKAMMEKPWYPEHLKRMSKLGHEALANKPEVLRAFAANFKFNEPAVRAKHKASCHKEMLRRWRECRPQMIATIRKFTSTQAYKMAMSQAIRTALESPELRARLRDSTKELWENAEYREQVLAGMSRAVKEKWADHAWRNKLLDIFRSPQHREKLSAISKEQWANEEYRNRVVQATIDALARPEVREKHSDSIKRLWETQEYREKVVVALAAAMARPEVREKLSDSSKKRWADEEYRNRTIQTIVAVLARPEVREKLAIARALQGTRTSSIQLMLYAMLDELGIQYSKEGEDTRVGFYVFDCMIPLPNGRKLLIECQGDYWHSLPHIESKDKSKFTYIQKYFPEYEVMYVWEHEFYAKDRVLDRLKLKLGVELPTVQFEFNELVVEEIQDKKSVSKFLDLYHYIGKSRGGKCIGAYHNGELVACVVFSPPLRQNQVTHRELSRLCIHPSYHKKNFATWLIARALKFVDTRPIVAFADSTVGHTGVIYKASNFRLDHVVPADYWYVDSEGYVMHKRTLYGKARSLKLTEEQYAEKFGYMKKFGGHKYCFIYE